MNLSRKDTILIAVLINLGLITVLLITAISFDDEPQPPLKLSEEIVVTETAPIPVPISNHEVLPTDEVDQVLQAFQAKEQKVEEAPSKVADAPPPAPKQDHVEITVKRGDSLDRLARANKTTIREIKKINDLKTDRLRIGQVLKIPLPKGSVEKEEAKSQVAENDSVYYVLEKGDNPWKIAKKFHVSYESIIDLNDLNETKARALKPGDRIRIR